MKYLIIALVTIITLSIGGIALAETTSHSSWYVTDSIQSGFFTYQKTYDENTGVVCYSTTTGTGAGISCLQLK